jgi:hypothetical protein
VQHQHRVLAAQLERRSYQPSCRPLRNVASGLRRTGEAHIVGGVDDGSADRRPVTEDELPQLLGKPGFDDQVDEPRRGQRNLAVRLLHDSIPREQRRDRVTCTEHQWVVPRRDDSDDALGVVALDGSRGDRHRAGAATWPQVARRPSSDDPGMRRDAGQLLEGGRARLSVLDLNQVERFVLTLQEQIVKAQHHPRAISDAAASPRRLHLSCDGHGTLDIVRRRQRKIGDRLAREWRIRRHPVRLP